VTVTVTVTVMIMRPAVKHSRSVCDPKIEVPLFPAA